MSILAFLQVSITVSIQVHVPVTLAWRLFPKIQSDTSPVFQVCYQETSTTNIARTRVHHRQGQLGSNGSIYRITALLQDHNTYLAGQRMGRNYRSFLTVKSFLDEIIIGVWEGLGPHFCNRAKECHH